MLRTGASHTFVNRLHFLDAIRERAPEVLHELRDKVFPGGPPWDGLEDWVQRWRLTAPWIPAQARDTLALWARYPSVAQRLDWGGSRGPAGRSLVDEADREVLVRVTWNPAAEPRDVARKRAEAAVRRALDAIEQRHREAGFTDGKARRSRKAVPGERWGWLVGYQVLGMSAGEISENSGVALSTVVDAVRELAAEVGLKLRAQDRGAGPGRPETPWPG
jgi:hypothetical protein